VAVYDRWHKDDGDKPCEHSRGRHRLYPSAVHGQGRRWQVQWEDPNAPGRRRLKRSFDLRDPGPGELPDRNRHASAFDKEIQGSIVRQDYADPNAGNVTFREYAETWRMTRTHSEHSAALLAARFRNHVYEDDAGGGRAPKGAVSIGQHPMSLLRQRPSLTAAWAASLKGPLPAQNSRRQLIGDVSAVFAAAVEDGVIGRNPVRSSTVDVPGRGETKARPFTAAEVGAIGARLPPRLRILARLGAGMGAREMELAALGVHDVQFLGRRPRVRVERQLKRVNGQAVFAPLKNRKPHSVPLAPAVADALARHLEEFPAAEVTLPWHEPGSKLHGTMVPVRLLLSGEGGVPLTAGALQSAWRSATGRKVKGMNPHRLRHTYASMQLRKGVDVVRVAAWLGDTVAVVVRTYAHLMPGDDEADGRAAVDDFFGLCAPDVPGEGENGEPAQAGGGAP
jgi:integrase